MSEAQRILLDRGIGQRELARIAGGSPSTSRDWLTGKLTPSQNKRSAIAAALPYCPVGLWDMKPHGIGMIQSRAAQAATHAASLPQPTAVAAPAVACGAPPRPPAYPAPGSPDQAPRVAQAPAQAVPPPAPPPRPRLPPLESSRAPTRDLDPVAFPPGSAKRSARELLDRVQMWREEAEAERNLDWLAKLIPQESRAIAELARYSGELSASDEDRLTRTTRWSEVVAALQVALRPYPDAAEAASRSLAAFDTTRRGM